jgi:hypothetical protein
MKAKNLIVAVLLASVAGLSGTCVLAGEPTMPNILIAQFFEPGTEYYPLYSPPATHEKKAVKQNHRGKFHLMKAMKKLVECARGNSRKAEPEDIAVRESEPT